MFKRRISVTQIAKKGQRKEKKKAKASPGKWKKKGTAWSEKGKTEKRVGTVTRGVKKNPKKGKSGDDQRLGVIKRCRSGGKRMKNRMGKWATGSKTARQEEKKGSGVGGRRGGGEGLKFSGGSQYQHCQKKTGFDGKEKSRSTGKRGEGDYSKKKGESGGGTRNVSEFGMSARSPR